jgi:hypothetical protein
MTPFMIAVNGNPRFPYQRGDSSAFFCAQRCLDRPISAIGGGDVPEIPNHHARLW